MRKNKPTRRKSNLPGDIKIKLWGIMSQISTLPDLWNHLVNNPDILTDSEWQRFGITRDNVKENARGTITRDTYRGLQQEIRAMPFRELATLPENIQNWVRGLRGDTNLQQSIESLIQLQENHFEDLANAARRLADNLKPYLLENSGLLCDYVVGTEKDQNLEEQLWADSPTEWLLSHMKTEIPSLKKLDNWLDVSTKEIDRFLLERLNLRAAQKYFMGECKVCEKWYCGRVA